MVDMSGLVGTVRRFGLSGPPYEVIGAGAPAASGEAQMRILLIETGEEVLHSIAAILADPKDD